MNCNEMKFNVQVNEIPSPRTLAEIYSKPIFFNALSDGANKPLFLNKASPDRRSLHCNKSLVHNRG